jgi:hypothetical protein
MLPIDTRPVAKELVRRQIDAARAIDRAGKQLQRGAQHGEKTARPEEPISSREELQKSHADPFASYLKRGNAFGSGLR